MSDQTPPPASFHTILYMFGTQAMIALGEIENPFTKTRETDLDQAKWHVDSIEVLAEKTKGNLTDEEQRAIDEVLGQLRMSYVQKSQANVASTTATDVEDDTAASTQPS